MSDAARGRGLASDEFDDDEIDWDGESREGEDPDNPDSDGLPPIEEMVAESMDAVVPDKDDDAADEDA